jgi:hypothetical protein
MENLKKAERSNIDYLVEKLKTEIIKYEDKYGETVNLKIQNVDNYDYINPLHYVQDDGRQTWERMLDIWTPEQVALWCEMTVFKYEDRAGKKPNEDIEREAKKIQWYKDKAKELYALNLNQ